MLEHHCAQPKTWDWIRASWLGKPIEDYVGWLSTQGYSANTIRRHVTTLMHFVEYSGSCGASRIEDLPDLVDAFVVHMETIYRQRNAKTVVPRRYTTHIRHPVEKLLRFLFPELPSINRRQLAFPFRDTTPGFPEYLRLERGLQEITLSQYAANLRRFERHLNHIGLSDLGHLTPPILSAFIVESGRDLRQSSMHVLCSNLCIFLRYLHQSGLHDRDLGDTVDRPRVYRLAAVPRSITWPEIERTLESVDRRTTNGKRDYAMLLLLVVYGLRAREVASLTLDSINWERERLLVADRKAGHNAAFPLASSVAEAIIDYLRNGRPNRTDRALFLTANPPFRPIRFRVVCEQARTYLHKAGVAVHRPGSHTLRHSCVQRLVDARFPLKTIGDFIGHRDPNTTEIYTKIDLESLRELALGDGESVL